MVSVAEQLAANLTFSALAKSKELKKRIWFTLGALLVYRLGTYIPLPGIDPSAWDQIFQSQAGGILSMFKHSSGGIHRMAIFALNIMPYISATILIQLMTTVSPTLEQIKTEDEQGPVINQRIRYLTVVLAALQSYGVAVGLEGANVVSDPGWFFRVSTVFTLTGGTVFLMWLAEQITSRGLGKGTQLILFTGIVAEVLSAIFEMVELDRLVTLAVGLILVAEIGLVVFMGRAHRRLLIHTCGGQSSHLSLKLNTSVEIPPIFASSLLLLPTTIANFSAENGQTSLLSHGKPLFLAVYVALIVFFAFFHTARVFDPAEVADNLKKEGGFIPKISPGERTAKYIDYVLTRITVVGAAYLAAVCLIPEILITYTAIPFYLGGTDLLVAVSVPMSMIVQVQGLLAPQHRGLITKSKLGGRRR